MLPTMQPGAVREICVIVSRTTAGISRVVERWPSHFGWMAGLAALSQTANKCSQRHRHLGKFSQNLLVCRH